MKIGLAATRNRYLCTIAISGHVPTSSQYFLPKKIQTDASASLNLVPPPMISDVHIYYQPAPIFLLYFVSVLCSLSLFFFFILEINIFLYLLTSGISLKAVTKHLPI